MAASVLYYLTCLSLVLVSSALPRSDRARASFFPNVQMDRGRNRNIQCGGELTDSSGEIKSPRFPSVYPDEIDCTWTIVGQEGSRITLTFVDFEIETSHECEYDSLEVYNGATSEDTNRVARLCGSRLPDQIVSTGSTLVIRFHSDFSVGFKGFKLQYSQSGCSRTLRGMNGELKSPNHPALHPKSLECSYLIHVPSDHVVVLSFNHFNLEPSGEATGCVYDYVEVFDGQRADATELGKFCGNQIPGPVRSSSNKLLVKFVSDESVTHTGFSASYTAESEATANPCLVNNGGCSDICSKTVDGMLCSCRQGYSLDFDGKTCTDINECVVNNGGCSEVCFNTEGGFQCTCGDGYIFDNKTCINENECATGNNDCKQLCRDTEGSYYCECHKGYRIGADRITCEDVDECKLPKSFHHCQQTCVNTPGSYYCTCRKGFRLSANGKICRDEDECLMGGARCEQRCVNTPGDFYCDCYQGYHLDERLPHKCVDTNECLIGKPDCHRCFNTEGSFRCECDEGYVADKNETHCADIDECALNNGNCSQICVNKPGAHMCECMPGYNGTDPKSRNCEDIDECAANDGKGDCDYSCENSEGSFRCSCAAGFYLQDDGLTCLDIDECEINNGNCSQKCVNVPGNYSCGCFDGYVNLGQNGSDVTCLDIDECFEETHECDSLGTCINKAGNYSCQCPDGYNAVWKDCIDIDECLNFEVHLCGQVCNNTPGSFHCECREGFVLDDNNKTCHDVDECKLNRCEKGCVNSLGSYQCTCPSGFQLAQDGHHCEDENECLDDNGGCEQRCVNENGSHSCACRHGFKLLRDGTTCRDIDECLLNTACCNHGCINTEGGYNCTCQPGYTAISNCTCVDINECQTRNGGCEQICANNPGSYSCSCASGFVVDGRNPTRCTDINECLTDNGGCHHNCTNTPGSYQCTCHPTHKLQMDGKTCGHCPTCDDFELLMQTVDSLKKQIASLEVWKQSVNGEGCIFQLKYKPNGSSWRKGQCEICSCEGGKSRCEPILGCSEKTTVAPTKSSVPTTDDEDSEDSTTSSGESPTAPVRAATARELTEAELFSINKRRQRRRGLP